MHNPMHTTIRDHWRKSAPSDRHLRALIQHLRAPINTPVLRSMIRAALRSPTYCAIQQSDAPTHPIRDPSALSIRSNSCAHRHLLAHQSGHWLHSCSLVYSLISYCAFLHSMFLLLFHAFSFHSPWFFCFSLLISMYTTLFQQEIHSSPFVSDLIRTS